MSVYIVHVWWEIPYTYPGEEFTNNRVRAFSTLAKAETYTNTLDRYKTFEIRKISLDDQDSTYDWIEGF